MILGAPWVALLQLRVSLEVPGPPLGVPGEGPGGPGGAPGISKPPRETSVNPAGLRTGREPMASLWRAYGGPVANRLIRGGSGPPLKLLAKAKSDENERRQRVADLTRPGPRGPANLFV